MKHVEIIKVVKKIENYAFSVCLCFKGLLYYNLSMDSHLVVMSRFHIFYIYSSMDRQLG